MQTIPINDCFFFPKREYKLDDFGSQWIDINLGHLLQALVQITKEDATILEIGAGLSSVYIQSCLEKRNFYTCDIRLNLDKVPANIHLIPYSSEILLKEWIRPIDFLWIDGNHSYKGCMNDLGFTKFLVSGGFLLVHDMYNAGVPGVNTACSEVITSDKYHIYKAVGNLWEDKNVLLTNYEGDITHKPDPFCCLFAVKK